MKPQHLLFGITWVAWLALLGPVLSVLVPFGRGSDLAFNLGALALLAYFALPLALSHRIVR